MSRANFKILRDSIEHERESEEMPTWLKFHAKNIINAGKTAVDEARERDAAAYQDITNILNGKSKHATVDSIVNEMQERTGLKTYIERIQNTKFASSEKPTFLAKHPAIDFLIKNIVKEQMGEIAVPALIANIRSTFSKEITASELDNAKPELDAYIDNLCKYYQSQNSQQMDYTHIGHEAEGFSDSENNDAFSFAEPSK